MLHKVDYLYAAISATKMDIYKNELIYKTDYTLIIFFTILKFLWFQKWL